MLVGHVLTLVGVGVLLGVGVALVSTRLMGSLLFGVTALDPPLPPGSAAILCKTIGFRTPSFDTEICIVMS